MVASAFCNRNSLLAKRTFFRLVSRNRKMEQREYLFLRHAEISCTTGTVDEQTNAYDITMRLVDHINDFLNGTASSNDIFNNENLFTWFNMETAAQGHLSVFTFCKDGTNTQKASGYLRQNNTACSRSNNGLNTLILKMFCKFTAELFCIFRMLQYIKLFYIQRAV